MTIFPNLVTPECFNRGSAMLTTTLSQVEWVGGPDPDSPGFPLKACGNDGPRIACRTKPRGMNPQ